MILVIDHHTSGICYEGYRAEAELVAVEQRWERNTVIEQEVMARKPDGRTGN